MHATITECLYWFDGPQIFQGLAEDGVPIVAIHIADTQDSEETPIWLVAKISQDTMDGVLSNQIPLRDALTTHRIGAAMTSESWGNDGDSIELVEMDAEPDDKVLPCSGTCLRP
jgi:hypothetical protein